VARSVAETLLAMAKPDGPLGHGDVSERFTLLALALGFRRECLRDDLRESNGPLSCRDRGRGSALAYVEYIRQVE